LKRSRRELSIDVAERKSILKTNRNTHYPRFSFSTKTGTTFPKLHAKKEIVALYKEIVEGTISDGWI